MDGQTLLVILAIAAFCFFMIKRGFDSVMKDDQAERQLVSRYGLREYYKAGGQILGFNFEEQRIVLGSLVSVAVYNFSQISSVEVIENEVAITSTNRGSQILGTVVGGLALGPAGSVIGGLSGSKLSRTRLRDVALKVFVDDPANPAFRISFFHTENSKGVDPDEASARDGRAKADRFHAHLLNAMRQTQAQKQVSAITSDSSVSELRMLWEMKQAGALTDDEFAQQKARLLGAGVEGSSA